MVEFLGMLGEWSGEPRYAWRGKGGEGSRLKPMISYSFKTRIITS